MSVRAHFRTSVRACRRTSVRSGLCMSVRSRVSMSARFHLGLFGVSEHAQIIHYEVFGIELGRSSHGRKSMRQEPLKLTFTLMALGLMLGVAGHNTLNGQQKPPTEAKGITASSLASLDLGPEIPGLQGRYLRARLVTADPGGHSAVHSHNDRPAIPYVLRGMLTQCTPDGKCRDLREGEAGTADKDTVHWDENKGKTTLVYLVLDISREP
jgi:quercetin dioxygenase-like cupin family protein